MLNLLLCGWIFYLHSSNSISNPVFCLQISLEKIKYLILDEADRMLDMGFGPEIKKIVTEMNMPPKTERQTLMFSATFPKDVQEIAWDYLNHYLFLTVGRVGGACSDVTQSFFEVERNEKRSKLNEILTESGMDINVIHQCTLQSISN